MPPGGDEVAARIELLDAVVARVHHVHVSRRVRGQPADGPELAVAAAVGAPLGLEGAARRELLHHVAELVGHEHVPLCVKRHRLGEAQHALGTLTDDVRRRIRAGAGARAGAGFRAGGGRAGHGDDRPREHRRRRARGAAEWAKQRRPSEGTSLIEG